MYVQNQYSAFTHLARSILGARYHREESLFAMMTCYFDESLEEWNDGIGKPHKFTFVSGYVASVEQWEAFEIEWRQYLDSYGIQDFHLTDYCASENEFEKWKDKNCKPIRDKFMQDASRIVAKFARYGFISAIADGVFRDINDRYMVEEYLGSSYGLVGRTCADLAYSRRLNFYPNESDLEYVFEDGGPDKHGLIRAMTKLTPAFPDPIFKPGKTSKSSPKYPEGRKAVLQLQAADYLAYEARKLFADQIKNEPVRGIRKSFKAIANIPTAWRLFTDKKLESMCIQLRIPLRATVAK
jgi:hypothetical protein